MAKTMMNKKQFRNQLTVEINRQNSTESKTSSKRGTSTSPRGANPRRQTVAPATATVSKFQGLMPKKQRVTASKKAEVDSGTSGSQDRSRRVYFDASDGSDDDLNSRD